MASSTRSLPRLNVIFPLETTVREFEFRLFLASHFINEERRIFIGRQEAMLRLLPFIDGGIYVGKNVFEPHEPDDLSEYEALKNSNIVVLHLDEEGGIYRGDADTWREVLDSRVNPTLLEPEDYVCTWGEFQRDHYASKTPRGAEVLTTGHPRFDLYSEPYRAYFERDAKRLRDELGEFVLVNTNFSHGNHQYGTAHVFSPYVGYDPANADSVMRAWLHTRRVQANFIELLHEAAQKFPDTNFVIRPHPSEEWSLYDAVFAGRDNVQTRHEGPVGPWMLAAEAIIHDGCTTGLESHFAGAHLINYRSEPKSSANSYLPNLFGHQCGEKHEVLDVLADVFAGRARNPEIDVPQQARDLLHNFDEVSYDQLLPVMEKAAAKVRDARTPKDLGVRLAEAPWQVKESTKDFVRPLFRYRYHMWKNHRSRFVDVDPSWVNPALERVAEITGKRMEATFVSSRLFYLDLVS